MDFNKVLQSLKKPCVIKALLYILFYFLIMFVFSNLFLEEWFLKICENLSGINRDRWSQASMCNVSALYNFIIYIILFIPLLIGYSFELSHDYYHLLSTPLYKKFFFISLGIFYIANIVGNSISNLIYSDSESVNQLTINVIVNNNITCFLLMFISAGIIGPIVEELIFRQAFFDIFQNKYASITISTIFFASIHLTTSFGSFLYMVSISIPYLVSGFVFGLIYEKSHRNIWLTILVHALSNIISLILIVLI